MTETLTRSQAAEATPYPVPSMEGIEKGALIDAPELQRIAAELGHRHLRINWRNSKGGSDENPQIAGVSVVQPVYRPAYGALYTAWVSAPWVKALGYTRRQMEAQVYNLCCRCVFDKNDKPVLRKPPIAAFPEELLTYGPWSPLLKDGAAKLREYQMTMPGMED